MAASLTSSQSEQRGRNLLSCPRTLNSDASPTRGSKRSITVDVVEGHQLRNPITEQHVVQPTIHIGFGKGSSVTPIGRSQQHDRFRFEHRTELAYNGESVLRFLLVDGVLQLGFKDIPIDDSTCPEVWKGPVTLMSRSHGSCGTIEVLIQKTNRRVLPGWLKAPELVPPSPLAAAAGDHKPSQQSAISGSVHEPAGDYANDMVKPSNFRSCRLTLLRADGLTLSETGSSPENPYVSARFGKHELRTKSVPSDEVVLNQIMIFPYENNKYLQLEVRDDRGKGAKDPICGSSVIDMEPYLYVGERRVDLPIANKSAAPGKVQALIDFREEPQSKAWVDVMKPPAVRREESQASSHSSDFRRKVEALVGVNNVKLQLIDTEDDLGQSPYVMAHLAKHSLRSTGGMKSRRFNETFVFPYDGQKYLRVIAYRDLKMRRDPIMGRARIDLEPYIRNDANSDIISIPLVDPEKKRLGDLRVRISSSKDNVSKPFVQPDALPADLPRSSSTTSSHEALVEASGLLRSTVGSIHCRPIALKQLKPEKQAKSIRPYAKCQFGDTLLSGTSDRSATGAVGDVYPLHDKFILPYKPYRKLLLMAYNDVSMARDVCLGKCEVDLDEWQVKNRRAEMVEVPIFGEKGGKTGVMQFELDLQTAPVAKAQAVRVLPNKSAADGVKSYRVVVRDAQNLTSSKDRAPCPFVEVACGQDKAVTATQTRDGCDPTFEEVFEIPADANHDVVFTVIDAADPANPRVIGSAAIRPETAHWKTSEETAVNLPLRDSAGKQTGTLRLSALASETGVRRVNNVGKEDSMVRRGKRERAAHSSFDIFIENCRDLQNPKKAIDTLDPYVIVTHGDAKLKSAILKNAGDNPNFNERFRFPTDHTSQLVRFDVYDKAHIVKDPLLGSAVVDIGEYDARQKVPLAVALTYKNKAAGTLNCVFAGSNEKCPAAKCLGREEPLAVTESNRLTASQLIRKHSAESEDEVSPRIAFESFRVKLVNARGLVNPKAKIDTLDPYVRITHGKGTVTSIVKKNAGDDPDFNQHFEFPVSNESQVVKFDVYDQAHIVADTFLGSGDIMVSIIRSDSDVPVTVQLFDKKGKAAGALNVELQGFKQTVREARAIEVESLISRSTSSASVPDLTKSVAPIIRNHQSFYVTLKNGRQLTSTRPGNALDPFVTVMHGPSVIHGSVCKQAGTDPEFCDEKFIIPTAPKSQTVSFEVRDAGGKSREASVGIVSVGLDRFPMKTHDPKTMSLELLDERGRSAGFLNLEIETLPTPTYEAKVLGRAASPRAEADPNLSRIGARSLSDSSSAEENIRQIKVDQRKPEPSMSEKARNPKIYKHLDLFIDRAEGLKIPQDPLKLPHRKSDTMDAYLVVKHSDYKVKSTTKKSAGANAQFKEAFKVPATDKRYASIEVHDNAHIGPDPLIGKCFLDLDTITVKEGQTQQYAMPVMDKTGTDAGTLYFTVTPITSDLNLAKDSSSAMVKRDDAKEPSHKTSIYKGVQLDIVKVAELINPKSDRIDTLDPYCVVRFGNESIKGTVHANGGKSCSIDDSFFFPYQPYQYLRIDVYDRAHITKDALLGSTRINLDNYCTDTVTIHKMKIPLVHAKNAGGSGFAFLKLIMLPNSPGAARVVHNAGKGNPTESEVTTPSPTHTNKMSSPASEASSSSHGESRSLVKTTNKCVQIDLLNSFNLLRTEKDTTRKVNPYVVGRLGNEKLRSRTVSGGEECASYQEAMHFIYSGERKVKLEVFDNYKMGKDTLIGYSKIDLDPVVVHSRNEYVTCHLFNPHTNRETGTLCVRVRARPEMITKSHVESTAEAIKSSSCVFDMKALHFEHVVLSDAIVPSGLESLNPYLLADFAGRSLRGSTVTRSDGSAVFNDKFSFSTKNGGSQACLAVFDNRRHAPDALIGKAYVNVHQLVSTGPPRQMFEVPLMDKQGNFSGFLRGTLVADNAAVTDNAYLTLGKELSDKLPYKSVKGQIVEYVPASNAERPSKPYVEATFANKEVRLNHPGDATVLEEFEFSYRSDDTLKLELRDDLKMKRDPRLGTGLLRVDDALRSGGAKGQTTVVPIRNSSNVEVANIGVVLKGSDAVVSKARVLRSKAGGTPATVEEAETTIKSFTGQIVETSGLPRMTKPYVMFHSGKYELRLPHGTDPDSKEYFECPYKPNEAATIRLMDDLKFKRDPTLGTAYLDLEETLDLKAPKRVTVALKNNGNAAGTITFLFSSYDKPLPHARVITPTLKAKAVDEESEAEEEVVEDLRTSTIMTNNNSFSCQLLDFTAPENSKLKRPYIITTYGKDKLRTEHLFHNQTSWRETVIEYPNQKLKALSIELRDDLKMQRDPVVGTGTLDLDNVINSSKPVVIRVPLSKGGEVVYLFNAHEAKLSKSRIYTKKESLDASTAPSAHKTSAVTGIMLEAVAAKDLPTLKEPYVSVQFATQELKGMAQKKPEFYDNFSFPYKPYRFFRVAVHDKAASNSLVGESVIDLDNLIIKSEPLQKISVPLYHEGKSTGALNCRLHLLASLPACELGVHQRAGLAKEASAEEPGEYLSSPQRFKTLHLTIHRLEDIPDVDTFGAMDPYVKTQLGKVELVSDVFENAGTTVDIHTTFSFPYSQERYIKLSIFDANKVRGDKNAGEAVFDLTSFIEGDQLKCLEGANVVLPMTYKGKTQGACKGVLRMQRDPIPQPCTLKATYGATITN